MTATRFSRRAHSVLRRSIHSVVESLESRKYFADTIAPTASLTTNNLNTGGASDYTFTVTYADNVAIKVSTTDNNDVRVTGPNGFNQLAQKVSINTNTDGPSRTVTYKITAPGGFWDAVDNGTYTAEVQANQVTDTASPANSVAVTSKQFTVATPFAVKSGSTLSVGGTSGNDTIEITVDGSNYKVKRGADLATFVKSEIQNIVVSGRDGNDKIDLGAGVGKATLNGDGGNDTLLGADGNDTLNGGSGSDTLNGRGGADVMSGGADNDTADYSSRTVNLTIDLDDAADDGASGEGDNVKADLETIWGGSGNDNLTGNSQANRLVGKAGHDTLNGGDGNDTILGNEGNDIYNGNGGTDTADFSQSSAAVTVTLDNNANDGSSGETDNVKSDIENVVGSNHNDNITGSSSNNQLKGGQGNDTLNGSGGDDTLDGQAGADSMIGGSGNDTADYSSRTGNVEVNIDSQANDGESNEHDFITADIETLQGGKGNDYFRVNSSSDTVNRKFVGNDGNDRLYSSAGHDTLEGGKGDDSLVGGTGNDNFNGGDNIDLVDYSARTSNLTLTMDGVANDGQSGETDNIQSTIENVFGGTGNDSITGSSGNNTLDGKGGNDTVRGQDGDDIIVDSDFKKTDVFYGGNGTDTIRYYSRLNALNVSLDGVANDGETGENDSIQNDFENIDCSSCVGVNTLTGNSGNNRITDGSGSSTINALGGADYIDAGSGNNTVNGGDGNDTILAGFGNDSLKGEAGNDSIRGGSGNDTLVGGSGTDKLFGEAGADLFEAQDNEKDSLDGNNGADVLHKDSIDVTGVAPT